MPNYQCFTSDAVINELETGDHPNKKKLSLMVDFELLAIDYPIQDIVEVYIAKIEEIRKDRREISIKCDFDPQKLVEFYKERKAKKSQKRVADDALKCT